MPTRLFAMTKNKNRVYNMILIALFSALMCVGAWMHIPGPVPFTLQNFMIFCAICILGAKKGAVSIAVYLLLGAVGLPVFSGFSGGFSALAGPTAGFLWGFLLGVPFYALVQKLFKNKPIGVFIGYIIFSLVLYLLGTVWYAYYTANTISFETLSSVFGVCVLPFIAPDAIKALIAGIISIKVRKVIDKRFLP